MSVRNTTARPQTPNAVHGPAEGKDDKTTGPLQLSVIITCFNYATFVRQAIDSAVSQPMGRIEVIVVDDGSTDESWAAIRSYGDRITAIQTKRLGALGASLAGFSISTGRYVYFLDADDLLCEGAIGQIERHFDDRVSKIQFMLTPIDRHGAVLGPPFPKLHRTQDSQALIRAIKSKGHYPTPPTSGNIYRRDIYEDLGDLGYEQAIDGVPYLLAPFVGEVISVARPLGKYRIHDSNMSSFSTITPERMSGYAARFIERLSHLETMLAAKGLDGDGFRVRDAYAYVFEMALLRQVAEGRRIGLSSLIAAIGSIWREERGARAIVFILFYGTLFILPNKPAVAVVKFRLNQSANPRVRSLLKSMLGHL